MGILVLVWGIIAIVGMIIGFIPCLGALNWLNIPFDALGFILGIIAMLTADKDDKGKAIVGFVLCAVALLFSVVRLLLGGGIF